MDNSLITTCVISITLFCYTGSIYFIKKVFFG